MSANTERTDESTDDEQQSTERASRDLVAELEHGDAGEVGVPVDAICVSCGLTRAKRAPEEKVGVDARSSASFKHTCHGCHGTTWWNVTRVLVDVDERGDL